MNAALEAAALRPVRAERYPVAFRALVHRTSKKFSPILLET